MILAALPKDNIHNVATTLVVIGALVVVMVVIDWLKKK